MFGLSMWTDESSYCVQFELDIASYEAYVACEPGSIVTIDVSGQTWQLYVDSRMRIQSHGVSDYKISGRSISAKLGNTILHKTWPQQYASEIVTELGNEEVISVDWQLMDWIIPEGRLEANGETSIEVILKIAKAAGGLVQTKTDGSLLIYPAYNWDEIPDLSYGIDSDILSMEENLNILPRYNKVRVSDKQYISDSQIILEESETDFSTLSSKIIAWVHPWKETITLEPTATEVSVIYLGSKTETKEQWVELQGGEGSVEKFIRNIINVDYGDHPNLGNLSFDGSSVWAQSTNWSLAYITYETSYHLFEIRRNINKPVQFLAFE